MSDPVTSLRMNLFHDPLRGEELRDLYREIWRLAWPTFVAQGLRSIVMVITRALMGHLGDRAFNSVNLGMMVFMVIITVIAAVAVGTTALVAQAWGAGDRRRAGYLLQQSLIWGAILSILISLVGMPASRLMFHLMGADLETVEMGADFMAWLFAGIPLMAIGFYLAAGLRAAGDSRTPMYAGLIMGVLSLVLSYALILGRLGMKQHGALGAAWAIDISFLAFSLFLFIVMVTNKTRLRLPLRGWRLDVRAGLAIFRIGIPSALEWIIIQVGILIFTYVIYQYGNAAAAGYFAGIALLTFAQTPAFGFQTAAATLVGQSIGAGRLDRAESVFRHCAILGALFMTAIGVLLLIIASPGALAWAFGNLSEESIHYTRSYTILLMLVMPLMGVSFSVAGGLRGAGDTIPPLVASSVGVYGGRILLALAMYRLFHPPVFVIWLSMFPDLSLRILIMAARLKSGRWKTIRTVKSK